MIRAAYKINFISVKLFSMLILLATYLLLSSHALAQKVYTNEADVFKSDELVFAGVDFSLMKFIAKPNYKNRDFEPFLKGWTKRAKILYTDTRLRLLFDKNAVYVDTASCDSLNKLAYLNDKLTYSKYNVSKKQIPPLIRRLQLESKEGIGLLVVVEFFEKKTEKSSAFIVFFDIATRNILMCDYFWSSHANGFGMTNHWSNGLKDNLSKYSVQHYLPKRELLVSEK